MSDNEDKDVTSTNERKEENMEDDIPEEESKSENSEEKPQSSKSANGESLKTPVKVKVVKSDQKEEENEEEEDSDEESPKLGLLERPVVIESGKRERKKVERLSTADSTPKETKKVEIGEGSGDKLGDCPRIELQISKTKADDLKNLHRFLFNRVGKATEVKRNIRQFNGFTFSSSDQEHTKKLSHLKKQTIAMLKVMCEVLDLEKKGTRDVIAERVMDFCMCPKDSGKKLPAPKRKRSSGGKKKGTKKEKNEKKKKPAKEKKSKATAEDSDDEEKSEEEEDEEENEEENEQEEEEEEEEAPKKKKARTESPKKTETPKKTEMPKKKKSETKKKEVSSPEISDSSDSDEDEPLQAKKKQPPSNDELKGVVKKILDKANLEEVTMKTVVKQVYAKYPEFDLTDRKDFIKNTVKQMIS